MSKLKLAKSSSIKESRLKKYIKKVKKIKKECSSW